MSAIVRIVVALACIATVCGHGFVHTVVTDSQIYPGWNPFSDPYANPIPIRIVRKIQDDGFVSSSDPDLGCNHEGDLGNAGLADVEAGSKVVFQWSYWPADHQGPVSTYMASCNGDCALFSAREAQWFKIDAEGYDPNTKQWAADRLRANNNSWVSTVPTGIESGQYLIRNEIIALHSATPQFYPSCSQLQVNGGGDGRPPTSDLVKIPGLYDNVLFPNIYSDFGSFTVPGPPPVTFGTVSGGSDSPDSVVPTQASSGSDPRATNGLNPRSSQCRLVRRSSKLQRLFRNSNPLNRLYQTKFTL